MPKAKKYKADAASIVEPATPAASAKAFLVKVDGEPFGQLRLTVPADTAEAAMQRVVDDLRSKMTVEG